MPVTINIRHLEKRDVKIQGTVPIKELGLEQTDELVQALQPLSYDLTAHLAGQDVLVTGKLALTFDCECSRCLKPFPFRLEVNDWMLHLPGEGPEKVDWQGDVIDLTPFLREAILLEFPQHPLCDSECAGLPRRAEGSKKAGSSQTPEASAWTELNKLKF